MLKFDSSLATTWPDTAHIDVQDHSESLLQQLYEKIEQRREIPYYSIVFGTFMPFLCAVYSNSAGSLRLEGVPVAELYFRTTLTPDQENQVADPDWIVEDEVESPTRDRGGRGVSEREITSLLSVSSTLDGPRWRAATTRESRRIMAATRPTGSRLPDSQTSNASTSSTSTVAQSRRICIIRVADGMFLVRAKVAAIEEHYPNADLKPIPTIPAVSVEVKVPDHWEDGTDSRISLSEACKSLNKALPQMLQHAQFIFHMYSSLSAVWVLGLCGVWAQFYRFTREHTPQLDPLCISHGEYYKGDTAPDDVLQDFSDVIAFMDEKGNYTRAFQKQWRLVMTHAEQQYANVQIQASDSNSGSS